MTRLPRSHRLRVMQSIPEVRPTTNPYLSQLIGKLADDCDILLFSWRGALTGDIDVFHVHWPELLLRGRTRMKSTVRTALALLLLLRLRLAGVAIVRTQHNLEAHERGKRLENAVLRLWDRNTTLRIRLNPLTPTADPSRTILHGDYRDHFAAYEPSAAIRGHIVCVGQIRAYKGVDRLIDVFARVQDPMLALRIAGPAHTPAIADDIRERAAQDDRVTLDLRYLDDAELVHAITSAELVVLPYRALHNSGVLLLALSLGRPVLAPRNEVSEALADEVGEGWIRFFDGELDGSQLEKAILSGPPPTAHPDLSLREWQALAAQHLEAYSAARASTGRRRTATPSGESSRI